VQAERASDITHDTGQWGAPIERVAAFLNGNGLEPTPRNYEIAYEYLTGTDRDLVRRVDEAISQRNRLSDVAVADIWAVRCAESSAAELARAAAEAQEHLRQVTAIVDRSGREARDYGATLERLTAIPSAAVVESLLGVTRTMIERTRTAEEDLRRTGLEISALRESLADARRKADTDPLTGLANRRALDARLRVAFDAARMTHAPLSIAICDIDRFKSINDTHGHQIGDEVIKFVSATLARGAEHQPFVARYGGEEFVLLFEGVGPEEAAAQIDKIRANVSAREFKVTATGRQLGLLSFSAGVACLSGRRGPSSTLKSADAALYRAKQEGRNCVRIA